jgi:N-acetylgalactosamine kinase
MGTTPTWLTYYRDACSLDENQVPPAAARLRRLRDRFECRFPHSDCRLVRAPGRVNLIGEHTDYNGYPVLPLAIERDILVCMAGREDDQIHLANVQDEFGERIFSIRDAAVPFNQGDWGNYVKAAIVGLVEWIGTAPRGFNAVFDGTVPLAAGLSSSSSMVVAAALSFLTANRFNMDKIQLAEILAKAELFVGTAGGGMDQAASLMGQKGHALRLDFYPLRVQPTILPTNYKVVICNSLVRAPKTESALHEYNRRPLECRIATLLLCRYLMQKLQQPVTGLRLADLAAFRLDDEEVAPVLGPNPLYLKEILERLQMPLAAVLQTLSVPALEAPTDGFKLLLRYRHVVTEADRVKEACRVMQDQDAPALGRLMNDSHASCRSLYEISTPELDRLVELARECGAVGSRLTGAGFGGCTVNLVADAKADDFIKAVQSRYYTEYAAKRHPDWIKDGMPVDAIFATRAVEGAGVLE